ncbi:HAD family hydrolase [Nakamurella sp.]|uniref:HAD family hydrolase n=1 Tax=Nakamurella sp. TaxID=1869182 RepID=UPI003B3B1FBE
MTTVIASDLDRTLIFSAAAAAAGTAAAADLVCVEMLQGRPQSFMTAAAHRLLAGLRAAAVVVPTTTRTPDQFGRVRLPGGPAPFAVVSNGGHILCDGVPDAGWRAGVQERIAAAGATLEQVVGHIDARTDASWVRSRRIADDLFCYLVVELGALPRHFMADLTAWSAERDWVVSMQGRKIYALPAALTKEAAVAEIMRRVGATRLLAAGDGALDAGMLAAAHDGIRPAHGELHENGWTAPHVRVTAGIGALAGEEIVRWLAAQVS